MNSLIIFCASYLYLFVIIGATLAWYKTTNNRQARFIVATVIAGAVAFMLSRLASHVYYDPRPFVTGHVTPLIAHAADNGFPSDHALLTMTLTAITYFFNKRIALWMLALSVIVGIARVLANVHTPVDIGAAWAIGIVGAIAGYYLSKWLFYVIAQNRRSARM